jgi:hypothetical protein
MTTRREVARGMTTAFVVGHTRRKQTMNEMTSDMFETLDDAQMADIVGGGFGKECAKGAAAGAIGGLLGGPWGVLAGGALGCIGGIVGHAIDKAK